MVPFQATGLVQLGGVLAYMGSQHEITSKDRPVGVEFLPLQLGNLSARGLELLTSLFPYSDRIFKVLSVLLLFGILLGRTTLRSPTRTLAGFAGAFVLAFTTILTLSLTLLGLTWLTGSVSDLDL
ncbi:hypothetical protein Salat_2759900 [Sesamum alatum]|uniref:Uncharacterized protein n=1 Tax=Sesamum alatum TaxID=300844 RepID=A0AAE1XL97_9LAMI|nr:hypothetical protein Salat_2759900 [Sesamum alatum]